MAKIAVVGDLHFQGKKLGDKSAAWQSAVDKIIELKTELVILTGDIFHKSSIGTREASTGTVYRAFMEGIERLKAEGIPVKTVIGNHDAATGDQKSALEPLKDAGIGVIEKISLSDNDWVMIGYIPWTTDDTKMQQGLDFISGVFTHEKHRKHYKILTGHVMVAGATMNSGISLMGKECEITLAQLESMGADYIGFGHIHTRQKYYIGALSQSNFGEENNPQGFDFIDTATRKVEYVKIDAPEYKTFETMIGSVELMECPQNYIKLRLSKKPDNYNELMEFPNLTIEIVPERVENERKIEGIDSGKSMEELLKAYMIARQETDEASERLINLLRGMEK